MRRRRFVVLLVLRAGARRMGHSAWNRLLALSVEHRPGQGADRLWITFRCQAIAPQAVTLARSRGGGVPARGV